LSVSNPASNPADEVDGSPSLSAWAHRRGSRTATGGRRGSRTGGRAAACRAPFLPRAGDACKGERMAEQDGGRGRRRLVSVRLRYGHYPLF
jgi:hypothetical protein